MDQSQRSGISFSREEKATQRESLKQRQADELHALKQTQVDRLTAELAAQKNDYEKRMEEMEWEFLREHQQLRRGEAQKKNLDSANNF